MPDHREDQERRAARYRDQHYGQGGGYGQMRNSLGYEGAGPERRAAEASEPPDRQYRGGRAGFAGTYDGGRFDYAIDYGAPRNDRDFGQRFDDRPWPGNAGRGPRGYRRSDSRILEDVSDRLMEDDQLDASDIEVSVDRAEVTLNGSVDSRADKRRAEDLAQAVSGVADVQNNLRLQRTSSNTTPLVLNDTRITASPGRYR